MKRFFEKLFNINTGDKIMEEEINQDQELNFGTENNEQVGEQQETPQEPVVSEEPAEEPVPIGESPKLVEFEGTEVVSVLEDGKESKDSQGNITHYHCSMSDGTTKHVPIELFEGKLS